jgi:hypothetical protein
MQEKNRHRIELIRDFSRYSLIGLLVFNILSAFAILFINAEAFFLGQKIAGTPAVAYAMGLFLVTVILMFCLYRKSKGYGLITLVYAMVFFLNGYLAVLYYGREVPTAIYWLILVLSVILFASTLLIPTGKPDGTDEKRIVAVFTENPRAGLLLSAGVLLCFVLFTIVSMMNYQYETNTYLYLIEIDPETPLHNVTLMLPLPSMISHNISSGELSGNSLPYFLNYSQSIVETKNGTMIKIMVDSIEKPKDEQPLNPIRLYYSEIVPGPINSSFPLDQEPVLVPKFSPGPSPCTGKIFERIAMRENPLSCSVYGSTLYAAFDTAPSSRTTITVSFDGSRVISSSGPAKRSGYEDSVSLSFSGNAGGWYNATGSLLAG